MTDIEIAQKVTPKPIQQIADKLGIHPDDVMPYGRDKAKLPLTLINEEDIKKSKLVLVSAISPTPAGEGKTTTTIGLHEGLRKIGQNSIAVLREPSLGPVFGMKGGAAGGGYAQVIPMEEINLHFTGDFSAIEKANNLLAAMIDNTIQSKAPLVHIDPRTVTWKRVMDMNDRALRNTVVALGGKANGFPREDGFNITAASEVMAILCMAKSFADLKTRLGNIYIANDFERNPVYAKDIKAHGAMAVLLKDAIKPNLVQTLEGNPVIIHGGPFANIAQGTNTILATKMGMSLGDITVTEAGFAFDLGGEKFLDIKCREAGLKPDAVVLVATIRALKYHGGVAFADLGRENIPALREGIKNLQRHIENVRKYGLEPLVAINNFPTDTQAEVDALKEICGGLGVRVALSEVWAKGGNGGTEIAKALVEILQENKANFKPLYDLDLSIEAKVEKIAKEIYRADAVNFSSKAMADLRLIKKLGLEKLPVCIAKTQYSFSEDAKALGAPEGFEINIRTIEIAAGAGFVVPIAGDMMRMPGLPARPAAENIDIDADGNISGLF
jgi:formate--tetrahydrofolate ligase